MLPKPEALTVRSLLEAWLFDYLTNTLGVVLEDGMQLPATRTREMVAAVEVAEGIRRYFVRCLPYFLLYEHERPQLYRLSADTPGLSARAVDSAGKPTTSTAAAEADVADATKDYSDIYGVEHFVRLFST